MKNILISGISGKIGKIIYEKALEHSFNVICGIDKNRFIKVDCPIYQTFDEVKESVDLVIDFSSEELCDQAIDYATKNKCALLSGTTNIGLTTLEKLRILAGICPVCHAPNFSNGILAFKKIANYSGTILKNYDVCITETHASTKKDSPSGTAKDIASACGIEKVYSMRGGTIPGTHVLHFYGNNDEIEITHRCFDRNIFAEGALNAATSLLKKKRGFYTAEELLTI